MSNASREPAPEARPWPLLQGVVLDARFAFRSFRRNPGLTATILVMLTLGIGGSVAIFGVVEAVLLAPLPFRDADRLHVVLRNAKSQGITGFPLSYLDFVDVKEQGRSWKESAFLATASLNLTGGPRAEQVWGAYVGGNLFGMLGVPAELGRTIVPSDLASGSGVVGVLSQGAWQRRFGGDRNVLGKTLHVSGIPVTVVGVMPKAFSAPGALAEHRLDVFLPATEAFPGLRLTTLKADRGAYYFSTFVRLADGVSLAAAQAEADTIAAREALAYPDVDSGWGYDVAPLARHSVRRFRSTLLLLLSAVGFVLLIACANVASLLLSRATARQREIAIRVGLGATRARIVRQLLTEAVVLALLGGALGLAVAVLGSRLLTALAPEGVLAAGSRPHGAVLLFAFVLSTATGILFSLVPALSASRVDLTDTLKDGARGATGGAGSRLRSALVVFEIALALVLLVGAGLTISGLRKLLRVDPGIRPENLLTAATVLNDHRFPKDEDRAAFVKEVVRRLAAVPGVASAGAIDWLPLSGEANDYQWTYAVEGEAFVPPAERPVSHPRAVTPGTSAALGLRRLAGRDLDERDGKDAPRVMLVSETLARRHGGVQKVLGKRVAFEDPPAAPVWWQIVGVVADIKSASLGAGPEEGAWVPYAQKPNAFVSFVVRTAVPPETLEGAMRSVVTGLDPDQPLYDVKPMTAWLGASTARERMTAILLSIFAGLALVLASVGTYGVLSYSVSRRRHEIGVRMALGASRGDVSRLILSHLVRLTALGLAVGGVVAIALARVLDRFTGVPTGDPGVYGLALALLALVALLAGSLPVHRAARVPPMTALREE